MSTTPHPGFADQARKRTVLRVLGFALLAVGLVVAVRGGMDFAGSMDSTDLDDNSGFVGILLLGLGGFLCIVGLACLNAGFLGATARYGAGETMPVVKDSAAYLTDGRGILGVGRTADDAAAPGPAGTTRTGPFCSSCGVRNDDGARFCDACGHALA